VLKISTFSSSDQNAVYLNTNRGYLYPYHAELLILDQFYRIYLGHALMKMSRSHEAVGYRPGQLQKYETDHECSLTEHCLDHELLQMVDSGCFHDHAIGLEYWYIPGRVRVQKLGHEELRGY
jgi:hypothetical protein